MTETADFPCSPVNFCKVRFLNGWMTEQQYSKVIYIGDGGDDFCMATKLRAGDKLLARRAPRDTFLRKVRIRGIKAKVV